MNGGLIPHFGHSSSTEVVSLVWLRSSTKITSAAPAPEDHVSQQLDHAMPHSPSLVDAKQIAVSRQVSSREVFSPFHSIESSSVSLFLSVWIGFGWRNVSSSMCPFLTDCAGYTSRRMLSLWLASDTQPTSVAPSYVISKRFHLRTDLDETPRPRVTNRDPVASIGTRDRALLLWVIGGSFVPLSIEGLCRWTRGLCCFLNCLTIVYIERFGCELPFRGSSQSGFRGVP